MITAALAVADKVGGAPCERTSWSKLVASTWPPAGSARRWSAGRAADDPERGAEALSLLAAAYLPPGLLAPELALAHAHRAASHLGIGGEHLARCAAVALTAGDPSLAEELAGRAGRAGGGEALAIRATALLRLGDLAEVRVPLDGWTGVGTGGVLAPAGGRGGGGRLPGHRPGRPPGHAPGRPAGLVLLDVVVRPPPGRCSSPAWPPPSCWRWPPERLAALVAFGFLALGLGMAVLGSDAADPAAVLDLEHVFV